MSDSRDDLSATLLSGMQAMQEENGWSFIDLTVENDGRVWIETTGAIDLRDLADQILSAGYSKTKPPKVYPDHDINMERAPYCTVCGRDVQWDDNTESWQH